MEEKTHLSQKLCAFRCLKLNSIILIKKYFFLKNYVTSDGALSHNVLYYQQLYIAHTK